MTLAGDWWQLPPVRAPGFYSNPFGELEFVEQRAMGYFWERDENCIKHLFELVQPQRQKDKWFMHVLTQHRYGCEDWEAYCFMHGLPAAHTGSWMPEPQDSPECGNTACNELAKTIWPKMRSEGKSWQMLAELECEVCRVERKRRCRVALPGNDNDKKHDEEPFASAPYIHPFNYPKYHAQQLRSILFAKATHRRLLWVRAHDWPVASGDEDLSKDDLDRLRQSWLQLHD